ncbi:hypothetical protein C9W97_24600 [Salmonella enterica subsp. enterica serovar Enteritidis]|nr:hypothetical protein [Salmonella enterica subsp. enterica serovar Kottbus]EBW2353135.1 hypothetical protein [Salmonella enterica subsp. enterica serovar Enteritidis]EBY6940079.1 hypothetical protein [Salmonella enterica subsp. enterica serovar Newport]
MIRDGEIAKDDENSQIMISEDLFRDLLKHAVEKSFDERWYLLSNPDVGRAVRGGRFKSGLEHYLEFGFYENRLPYSIIVDEDFYIQQNPDIRDALAAGVIEHPQDHFNQIGYKEGRLPSEGWRLTDGPIDLDFSLKSRG